jgi:hypothetical protein
MSRTIVLSDDLYARLTVTGAGAVYPIAEHRSRVVPPGPDAAELLAAMAADPAIQRELPMFYLASANLSPMSSGRPSSSLLP